MRGNADGTKIGVACEAICVHSVIFADHIYAVANLLATSAAVTPPQIQSVYSSPWATRIGSTGDPSFEVVLGVQEVAARLPTNVQPKRPLRLNGGVVG